MCGICGIYQYVDDEPASIEVLGRMLEVIRHRGPDDDGVYVDRSMAFGMRRLSIIDLAGGKQPIFNETGDLAIVFNGEIYNYVELRQLLLQHGHILETASDTEVIVHLYEEFGERCVEYLRGMFGFAIWNAREKSLFIARDRLGIKPLYYAHTAKGLVFGSEIKSLLQYPGVHAQLDVAALNNYLTFKYVPAPQTLFAGVHSLPPGCILTCKQHEVNTYRYWDISFANSLPKTVDENECAEQLLDLLRQTTKIHLRSDVPFGAFLSGGLDSSTVVALMSEILEEPVKTFSVGFEQQSGTSDERSYARMVAQQFHTEHYEVITGPKDFLDLAETVIWHHDQPIADQATVATYMLAKLARQHVKMVLTGEGGDELFAGYARHAGEQFSPWMGMLPASARSLALSMSNHLPGLRRSKIALYALCQSDEANRLMHWFPLFNDETKRAVLGKTLRQQLNGSSPFQVVSEQLARTDAVSSLNRMLYVDSKLWLPDYLLLRGDKLTMANSLEARVPLLDHKVVEFAASLPTHLKLNGLTRKYLLRKVGSALLPPPVISRKKQGFPIPIGDWFRKEVRPFLYDILSPAALKRRDLFDVDFVKKLMYEHDTHFADHGMLLWGLASIELWHRIFIDRPQASQMDGVAPVHVRSKPVLAGL